MRYFESRVVELYLRANGVHALEQRQRRSLEMPIEEAAHQGAGEVGRMATAQRSHPRIRALISPGGSLAPCFMQLSRNCA